LTLEALLRRPEIKIEQLAEAFPELENLGNAAREQLEIAVKYSGYIDRQIEMVERSQGYEDIKIPTDIDYSQVDSLSTEVRENLDKVRPLTLGQAGRMQGITPAALAILNVYLRKKYHA